MQVFVVLSTQCTSNLHKMYYFFLNSKLCTRTYGLHVLTEIIGILPIAIDVSCFPNSAARSSTHPLASYPGTEHIKTGVLAFIW